MGPIIGTLSIMAYQVLFPGNNRIGSISVERLDPLDTFLKPPEGIVSCHRQNEPEAFAGILLASCQFTPAIMALLMSDPANLTVRILCSDVEGEGCLQVTVKIQPRVSKSNDDIFVRVGFKVTRLSFERFMQQAREKNKVYLTFKTSSYLFFFQFNPDDGIISFREIELYN